MSALLDAAPADFAGELVARAKAAGADAAQVRANQRHYFEVDFSARSIDLLRSLEDETAVITIFRDGKRGTATVNGREAETIETALASALVAAEAGVADPANDVADAPSEPAKTYGPAASDRAVMIGAVETFMQDLSKLYPLIKTRNSVYSFTDSLTCFANSRDVHQSQRRGAYQFGAMFSAKDGHKTTSFNYSGATSFEPFERLLSVGTINRLLDETLRSFDRKPVPEKFVGDVIITPDCLSSLMPILAHALSGAALFAGTTPYRESRGEMIASPLFSLFNRPRAADFPEGSDFDGVGVPTRDLDVVKSGLLADFLVDFYMSRKLSMPQTAGTWNFVVPGGNTTIEEIIRSTQRGIIFSRFSGGYPNTNLDFTGVAKNSFYIEAGKVRHALGETMVSGNFKDLLLNIHAVSRETVNFGDNSYPYLAASGVTISAR
jgi:PmbA protein